jgi:heme exporter protein C
MWKFFQSLASPKYFYLWSEKLVLPLSFLTFILTAIGVIWGLQFAPSDYQQGDAFRIIYIHVPSAILSLMIYTVMTIFSGIFLIWKIKLADILAKASVSLGASFTLIALITGSLWGKPMWGTWWIWDARLTSELVLLFIYLSIMALRSAITDSNVGGKMVSILTLVGFVDIPIIHFSVYWWNTLHQKPTLFQFAKPSIAPSMLYPLLIMIVAFVLFYSVLLLIRARVEVLQRERKANWVKEIVQ